MSYSSVQVSAGGGSGEKKRNIYGLFEQNELLGERIAGEYYYIEIACRI